MLALDWAGERLVLLPERAAYLPDHASLLVADAHVGKAQSFRRLGVPVPEATTAGTLARLGAALDRTGARRVVFLGDLLHSAQGRSDATLAGTRDWLSSRPGIDLVLVRGNHDRQAGDPPPDWRVSCVDEPWALGRLQLRHEPLADAQQPTVAGHVHPGVSLGGRAHDHVRLPCFHLAARQLVLPAFGEFTGLHLVARREGDRVFAVGAGGVHEVPTAQVRVRRSGKRPA